MPLGLIVELFSVPVEPPRRRHLPAWIRDGLSKMDRKGRDPGNEDLVKRPRATDVTGYGKLMARASTAAPDSINRNKISGYSVLQDSDQSSDGKVRARR